MECFLGVEFGSTRIKAVSVDASHAVVSAGDHTWASKYENGVWTYSLDAIWGGLKDALSHLEHRQEISAMGLSAMMHGYLAFDRDWNLLVPFRTWQNTMTAPAAEALSELFHFNIPQRWSIAHLYQAVLNQEPHIRNLAHITTLAGYVHFMLTGENVVGVGEGSGIFPLDYETLDYDSAMLEKFDALIADRGLPWSVRALLPDIRLAGQNAGTLTAEGAARLDGLLPAGIRFAPPEGDAETGMVATNAVAPRTGNVSAGTSIFSMVVLERPLEKVYPEVGVVATPGGRPVAMVHCSNCTSDMNRWVSVMKELFALFGPVPDDGALFTRLYELALSGAPDCGGITVFNYLTGESVPHLDAGRPMIVRGPDADFTLANFMRAQLYSTMVTLSIGMRLMAEEHICIDSLTGHGGLFKTPVVGQRLLAAALETPITVMDTADSGGAWGMALLTAYQMNGGGMTLEDYLDQKVFHSVHSTTLSPQPEDVAGFRRYRERFEAALAVEKAAVEAL